MKTINKMLDEIQHADALTFLKEIPDNSVDLCLTDPPYFYDNLGADWSPSDLKKKSSNSHIKTLPMGMKFDKKQGKQFQDFMTPIAKEIYRVLKPGGFFLCFSSPRLYHRLLSGVEDAGFEIRDMIGWLYKKSQVKAFGMDRVVDNDKLMTDNEKSELKEKINGRRTPQLKPAFEPICLAMKPVEGRFIDNYKNYSTGLMDCSNKVGDDKFPSNVMATDSITVDIENYYLVPKPSKEEKGENNTHPTIKPVNLCEHLIKLFCPPDGIVLDTFMGSGSTAVSAVNTGRHFCGCDMNKEYVDFGNKRVNDLSIVE
jgi:site-specific DNA-methyltransferase (adenine-specific)